MRLIRPLALALFLAALAALAILPEPLKALTATHGLIHDGLHIAAFLAAFLLAAGPSKSWTRALPWAVALLCFGALLEFLQTRIYGNLLELRDVLDDAIGVGVGFLIVAAVRFRRFPIIER